MVYFEKYKPMYGFKITLEKRILQQELICEDNFHQVETTC